MTNKEAGEILKKTCFVAADPEVREALNVAIKHLTSGEFENAEERWIPTTENLPQEMVKVIATYIPKHKNIPKNIFNDLNIPEELIKKFLSRPVVGICDFFDNKWFDEEDNIVEVIAWIPFPKPCEIKKDCEKNLQEGSEKQDGRAQDVYKKSDG